MRFASVLVLCVGAGCAHKVSSDLFRVDPGPAAKLVFELLVIGVDPPRDSSQSYQLEKFVEALREARLFKAVEYPKRPANADLVLTSFYSYSTNPMRTCVLGFEGQVLTIGTLGLVPQICKSEVNISFALYPPRNERQRKTISLSYQTQSIMGWAALFYLPFGDWTAEPPKELSSDIVKRTFYREASEIQKLVQN